MNDNYGRVSIQRHLSKSNTSNEMLTEDIKNDLLLAFNMYKNDENKINKLKLRTILFSFAMYKAPPKDINEYISEHFPKQEEFTYEELCKLVFYKLKSIKEKEAEDLFFFINGGKGVSHFSKDDISSVYEKNGIDISDREINEMLSFMTGKDKLPDNIQISKEEFKKFYI